jgi:hypothetical protein
MTPELKHSVEIAANTLAIAVEPLCHVDSNKAKYVREIARICSIGIFDVMNSIDDGRKAVLDTIEALEDVIESEDDVEETD